MSVPEERQERRRPKLGRSLFASRMRWLWVVGLLLLLGVALRGMAADSIRADVSRWLPWLNRPVVTLYFTDPSGRYFIPLSRVVANKAALPQTALDELLRGPGADSPLASPIPSGTTVQALAVRDGLAVVDLAGPALSGLDARHAARLAESVTKTLVGLEQIDQVTVSVSGRIVPVNLEKGNTAVGRPLYFVYTDYLVPVNSGAVANPNDPRSAMDTFLLGPSPDGVLAGLPADVQLLNLEFNQSNGLVKVNLKYTDSVRTLALAEPEEMRLILLAIIASLTEVPGVHAVMLDFEGQSQLGLGQCASLLRTPQLRPDILNDEVRIALK